MENCDIISEFNYLGMLAEKLDSTGRYDVKPLISSLQHMLVENTFFYGRLADLAKNDDPSRVYFNLKVNPRLHQMVYVQLGCGYAKELRTPHWCYVLTSYGQKLTVIPLTSIKADSGPARTPFEFDIVEGDGTKGRMHFDDIRSIDTMRIIEKKGYREVFTPRQDIVAAYRNFLGL